MKSITGISLSSGHNTTQATHANSSVVRKQFDRKFRVAQGELVFLKKLMLGVDPKNNHDPTFTASRVF